MKILHILGDRKLPSQPDRYASSGFVRSVLEFARSQVTLGHKVSIAVIGSESWKSEWNGVELLSLKPNPSARLRWGGRSYDFSQHVPYVRLTHSRHFDIVHGHLYNYLRWIRARSRILHFQTDPFYKGSNNEGVDSKPEDFRSMAKNSDAQIAASNFVAHELRRGFGDNANIHVVYNGVDKQHFAAARWQVQRHGLRDTFNIPGDGIALLFVGAIVPEKGVIHLASAFARLPDSMPHIHLILAGASTLWGGNITTGGAHQGYENHVQQLLQEPHLAERVHFLGNVPIADIPGIYAASDIVVVPSVWRDPFPLVALEAMAAGKPVIASRTGGLVESVNAESGLLVSPGDEADLEAALRLLITDVSLRQRLGKAAEQRAMEFSWERAAHQLNDIYAGALARKEC